MKSAWLARKKIVADTEPETKTDASMEANWQKLKFLEVLSESYPQFVFTSCLILASTFYKLDQKIILKLSDFVVPLTSLFFSFVSIWLGTAKYAMYRDIKHLFAD